MKSNGKLRQELFQIIVLLNTIIKTDNDDSNGKTNDDANNDNKRQTNDDHNAKNNNDKESILNQLQENIREQLIPHVWAVISYKPLKFLIAHSDYKQIIYAEIKKYNVLTKKNNTIKIQLKLKLVKLYPI